MNRKLCSTFGLKFNPFGSELPVEALLKTPKLEDFCWRIEHGLAAEGGFALITGEPGTGKSVSLRLLNERLENMRDVTVRVITHPQSGLADFYREMGELFGVALRPHNRWSGFRSLRERWFAHIDSTLHRPLLLIDEAQEMSADVLSELRILASAQFDSRNLLGVVLCGDGRLLSKLQRQDLLPVGSRLRTRLLLERASKTELIECLRHLLDAAGGSQLMTTGLIDTITDHAAGNYRALVIMAGELLSAAARREYGSVDEKLFLELYSNAPQHIEPAKPRRGRKRR
jgi:type II secretory pathway predicted ATPase ExeA